MFVFADNSFFYRVKHTVRLHEVGVGRAVRHARAALNTGRRGSGRRAAAEAAAAPPRVLPRPRKPATRYIAGPRHVGHEQRSAEPVRAAGGKTHHET